MSTATIGLLAEREGLSPLPQAANGSERVGRGYSARRNHRTPFHGELRKRIWGEKHCCHDICGCAPKRNMPDCMRSSSIFGPEGWLSIRSDTETRQLQWKGEPTPGSHQHQSPEAVALPRLYTPEKRDEDDREKVLVRLTPRALHELYIETKGLSNDDRMHGHSAECDLCGEQVDLDRAIPNAPGEPCHKRCWAEYTGAPDWFSDYV